MASSAASARGGVVPSPGAVPAAGSLPQGAIRITPAANDHVMVTQGEQGFRQPRTLMNLQATILSPIPKAYRGVLADPNRRDAIQEEFTALQANHTWDLVPPPPGTNIITGKWVYRNILHPDGTLTVTKLVGYFEALHSVLALILVRHSVLL